MRSSFRPEDVTLLLTDITGRVEPLDAATRQRNIQRGMSYAEMLPIEYAPSADYWAAYEAALLHYAGITAQAVARVSARIYAEKGAGTVLVSLARAGTPIGILIKRYMRLAFQVEVPHYTISIIRGVGIDHNAMKTLLQRHPAGSLQFIDGWTGKGAIRKQLGDALSGDYPQVPPSLAVLSDPAGVAELRGTREDFLIPSSCLNATVSGLLSRTFYRRDIIGPEDFHGAAYYGEWEDQDVTYDFIGEVQRHFPDAPPELEEEPAPALSGLAEARRVAGDFGIRDINLVKPGIGEATRVLLRRVPWKVLVHRLDDEENLGHLYRLAREKGVEVQPYPLVNYRACGLIRELADI